MSYPGINARIRTSLVKPFAPNPGGIKNDTAMFNKICLFFECFNICIGERAQT